MIKSDVQNMYLIKHLKQSQKALVLDDEAPAGNGVSVLQVARERRIASRRSLLLARPVPAASVEVDVEAAATESRSEEVVKPFGNRRVCSSTSFSRGKL